MLVTARAYPTWIRALPSPRRSLKPATAFAACSPRFIPHWNVFWVRASTFRSTGHHKIVGVTDNVELGLAAREL